MIKNSVALGVMLAVSTSMLDACKSNDSNKDVLSAAPVAQTMTLDQAEKLLSISRSACDDQIQQLQITATDQMREMHAIEIENDSLKIFVEAAKPIIDFVKSSEQGFDKQPSAKKTMHLKNTKTGETYYLTIQKGEPIAPQ